MKTYFVLIPNNIYAIELQSKTLKNAKQEVRDALKVNRLPNGTEFWANKNIVKYKDW